jgi:hypothetical protein
MKGEAEDLFNEVDGGNSGGSPDEESEEEDVEEAAPQASAKPSNTIGIDSSPKWQAAQKEQREKAPPTPIYDVKPQKEKRAA